MEVKCAAIFECDLELDRGVLCWYAAARDRLKKTSPDVGTKPGRSDARIVEVEDGYRERLELRSWRGWEVDDL